MAYKFKQIKVNIPDHDCDVVIVGKNGQPCGTLQFRAEHNTLDICFDKKQVVYVEDGDMNRIKADRTGQHKDVLQLVVM